MVNFKINDIQIVRYKKHSQDNKKLIKTLVDIRKHEYLDTLAKMN